MKFKRFSGSFTIMFLFFVLSLNANSADSPFKDISLTTAKEIAATEGKYIFIDFYADWCVPCKWMDQTTYTDDQVVKTLKSHFIPVKINIDDFDGYTLKEEYNVRVLPTIIILDQNGRVIKRIEESLSPGKLRNILSSIDTNSDIPYNENVSPSQQYNNDNSEGATATVKTTNTKVFRVQVGVFTGYANTLKLVDKINDAMDVPVIVTNSYLNGKTVYRIFVGDEPDYESAKALKTKIHNLLNINGLIKSFE